MSDLLFAPSPAYHPYEPSVTTSESSELSDTELETRQLEEEHAKNVRDLEKNVIIISGLVGGAVATYLVPALFPSLWRYVMTNTVADRQQIVAFVRDYTPSKLIGAVESFTTLILMPFSINKRMAT